MESLLDWPRRFGLEELHARAADGTRLRVVLAGPEKARRVVLLHGAPQHAYCWRQVIRALAGRYRVVAPDLRGYGASELAHDGRYDLDTLVGDVATVLGATASDDRTLLVAHDWGGPIAWAFAERHPERVRHLVAVNAPHLGAYVRELSRPGQALRSWYAALFQIPGLERLAGARHAAALIGMMTASAPVGLFAPEDLAIDRAALSRPGRAAAVLAYYRQALGKPSEWLAWGRAAVASPRIDVPATIVWGDADRAIAPSHPDAVRRYASRVTVRHLPGVSHWVPEERPEEIVRAILEGDLGTTDRPQGEAVALQRPSP